MNLGFLLLLFSTFRGHTFLDSGKHPPSWAGSLFINFLFIYLESIQQPGKQVKILPAQQFEEEEFFFFNLHQNLLPKQPVWISCQSLDLISQRKNKAPIPDLVNSWG